ncbi:hypothetical protein B4U79_17275 [Dinothrombium tinctorium]|uniref:Uncharacterized protein n=1 Tax=Dinothrombium tinctorium TaxID=1965070 RepID=A0A3S3PGA3_9ACAR|nr:hypothetical protein B4U79_16762 [Dinothrombium tinctorium]RWS03565.1 hypothetical protein B4U79_16498 [Dinothrombium tinctorium]RWS14642.1 hypothetical protein B4U79_17275 [Dinothrombium tinctorium]
MHFFRVFMILILTPTFIHTQDENSMPYLGDEAKAKVVQTNLEKSVAEDALKMAESDLLKYDDIETALDHLSDSFGQKYSGTWYCIRVSKAVLKSKLVKQAESYALLNIPPIDVLLFKLADNLEDSLSESQLIEATRPVVDSDFEIFQNNLPEDEQNEVLIAVRWAIKNELKFNAIEEAVTDILESKYGGQWRCFITCRGSKISTSGEGMIDPRKKSIEPLMYFGIGKLKILVYKPKVEKSGSQIKKEDQSYDMYEVIKEARLNLIKTEVNYTEMTGPMQQLMFQIAHNGINNYDSYEGITKYCREVLDYMYGKPWECLMGLDGQFYSYFWYKKPFFINFKVDRIRVIIIKQYAY